MVVLVTSDGLVASESKNLAGDQIALVSGVPSPLYLRRKQDRTGTYELVGKATMA